MESDSSLPNSDNVAISRPEVAVGLPGAAPEAKQVLHKAGIDPNRLSILHLGRPPRLLKHEYPPWVRRMVVGYLLWLIFSLLDYSGIVMPPLPKFKIHYE